MATSPNPFGPPPAKKGTKTEKSVFTSYIKAHAILSPYAQTIWKSAHEQGLDAVYFAALLWSEGGAEATRRGEPLATVASPTGAGIGPGQINPIHVGEKVLWLPSQRVTDDDGPYGIRNPNFNIQWSAHYFKQGWQGSYEATYDRWYNKNDQNLGRAAFGTVPKGYVSTTSAQSPAEAAQRSAEVKNAGKLLYAGATTYATIQKNGKFKFITTRDKYDPATGATTPDIPKGTIRRFGDPLTRSTFLQDYSQLADTYFAFTGKNPTYTQAATLLHAGLSDTGIKQKLVDGPAFYNSPAWKQNAPRYSDVYHTIFGPDQPVPKELVKYAIANSLDQSGFGDYLRQQPNYVKSAEFKQNTLTLENVFRQIYGEPNAQDGPTIYQAALHGYDSNQFASYLRAQPNYTSSPEYLTRATQFLDAMGLITGNQAVLRPGTNPSQLLPGPTIPNDPRGPQISPLHGINLVPGMSE